MATEADNSRQVVKLSVKQLNAIDLIMQGKTDGEVAKAVGVSRQTVNEWRNHQAVFVAELNGRRWELWRLQRERLCNLVKRAIDVMEQDLQGDDRKLRQGAAIHLLKAVGLYGQELFGPPGGATTPEAVEKDWARDKASAKEMEQIWDSLAGLRPRG